MSPRKKKPKRGRPFGPPENVRRRLVVLRLTDEEHGSVAIAAASSNEGVAEWMRRTCLDSVSGIRKGSK